MVLINIKNLQNIIMSSIWLILKLLVLSYIVGCGAESVGCGAESVGCSCGAVSVRCGAETVWLRG